MYMSTNKENLIFEKFIEPTVDLKYLVNLSHGSLYKNIKLITNEYFRINQSPVILIDIKKAKKETFFQFKVLENDYIKEPDFFDDVFKKIITEISLLAEKEIINEINLLKKIPSLENCIPKSKKKLSL